MNRKVLECSPRRELTEQDLNQLRMVLEHETKGVSTLHVYVRQFKFKGRVRVTIEYEGDYALLVRSRIESMIAQISRLTGSDPEILPDSTDPTG